MKPSGNYCRTCHLASCIPDETGKVVDILELKNLLSRLVFKLTLMPPTM